MGNCDNIKEKGGIEKDILKNENVKLSDFKKLYPIGKGGFGRVWKVLHKKTKKIYAMKEMLKVKIFEKKSNKNVATELKILTLLKNSKFISGIKFAFQTYESLYIITDYFPGGDLRYRIKKSKKNQFSEKEVKFLICNILIALNTLKENNIIHKDLKPENLIFDKKGYLHLCDFGLAKILPEHNLSEKKIYEKNKSGTIGYMAPEVLLHKSQSFQVDYFALGIITCELIFGKHPFYSGTKTKEDIKSIMVRKEINFEVNDLPNNTLFDNPKLFCDFVNKLLNRKKELRLGSKGINEIIEHPWLQEFDWGKLLSGEMSSPFETEIYSENYDFDYANQKDEVDFNQYYKDLEKINKNKIFKDFYYNIENEELIEKINMTQNDCSTHKNTFISFIKKKTTQSMISRNSSTKESYNCS